MFCEVHGMLRRYATQLIHVAFAICFDFRYPWEIHVMLELSEAI